MSDATILPEIFTTVADFREALVGEFLRAAHNFESGEDEDLKNIPHDDRLRAAASSRNVAQYILNFGLRSHIIT